MVRENEPSLSERFCRWAAATNWANVPQTQRELAKLRVLDTVGLIAAALDIEAARAVGELALQQGGRTESSLLGTSRSVPAAAAAQVHGIAAHCRDFDDTFVDSVVHPGSFVVPVALAVGEAVAATGPQIMSAIAIGYEIAARIGGAFNRTLHARGFHPSAVVGPLASALTAGKLYGLNDRQMTSAVGLAGSMSGGLMEFLNDGSWSKWLHLGWAAHGGVVAAQFAYRGFLGPATILEGNAGLYRSFMGEVPADYAAMAADLGLDWRGASAQFKFYPCAHVIQPYVDAIIKIKREHRLEPADIAEVQCAIAPWCVPLVCSPRDQRLRPQTELQAIASLPFIISSALVDGDVTLNSVATSSLHRPEVLALAERVHHLADQSLGTAFDGNIKLHTTDGRSISQHVSLSLNEAGAVRVKFRRNAAMAFDSERVAAIERAVSDESLDSDFFALLRRERTA